MAAAVHHHEYGMSELMQAIALVDDGVAALRDGGLLRAWAIEGQDFNANGEAFASGIRDRLAALLHYGKGWVFETNVVKVPAREYSAWGEFPSRVASLIEAERKANYTSGNYFRTQRFISLDYFPPSVAAEKAQGWFYNSPEAIGLAEKALRHFRDTTAAFANLCGGFLSLRPLKREVVRLDSGESLAVDELLRYLRLCVSGNDSLFRAPDIDVDIDLLLGCPDVFGGSLPEFGGGTKGRPVRVLSVDPVPQSVFPGMLRAIEALPIELRLHTRAILMDRPEAAAIHKANLARYGSKIQPFMAQVMKRPGRINVHAADMAADAKFAMDSVEDANEATAMFSARIILVRDNQEQMREAVNMVRRAAERAHVPVRVEGLNAVDAWCGSLPGHAFFDCRQVPLRSFNIASMAPLHTAWRGEPYCPSPKFPAKSSPLLIATGEGQEAHAFNVHVQDVGHTVVYGPVGNGKTTLFGLIAVSLMRYSGAQVIMFDRMRTQYVLCKAMCGEFYDLPGGLQLCPLQYLETESDLSWATNWIEVICDDNLNENEKLTAADREHISATLARFRGSPYRSLTHFAMALGNKRLATALQIYTVANTASGGVLDGESDNIGDSHFMVFEMKELMEMNPRVGAAVMAYLFRRIERKLNTSHVTGIFIDEAKRMMGNTAFAGQIKTWLAEIRNRNAFVIMALQEIEDAVTSPLRPAIEQECKTKIFLPNSAARGEKTAQAYRDLGLDEVKVGQIIAAREKLEYFIQNKHWSRVSLDLNPVTLAFIASNSDRDRIEVERLAAANPEGWPAEFLRARGLDDWADYFEVNT